MLSVTFTPNDKTDFATVRASVPLTVNPSPLSLTWATPKAITYGTKLTGTQLNAAATFNGKRVAGAYAYTAVDNSGGAPITVDNKGYTTILPAGSYTLTAAFTPTVPADFSNLTSGQLSTTVQMTVNQATPKITWATPKAIIYGTALNSTQLDPAVSTMAPGATTAVPGTFSFTATPKGGSATAVDSTGFTTVLPAGTYTLTATFTPTDQTDYTQATAITAITVNKKMPAIAWTPPDPIDYGTALSGTQLNASAAVLTDSGGNPVSGTFTYSPVLGTVLSAGSHTLSATFKPDDGADYGTPLRATVTLTVNKVLATISWVPAPSSIKAGTALVKGQLDARACSNSSCKTVLTGTWTYDQAAGQTTPTSAGPYSLTGTWTPSGTAATNYLPTPGTVDIQLLN